jgi:hypothetical protein
LGTEITEHNLNWFACLQKNKSELTSGRKNQRKEYRGKKKVNIKANKSNCKSQKDKGDEEENVYFCL